MIGEVSFHHFGAAILQPELALLVALSLCFSQKLLGKKYANFLP